ncbi:hypothetical protein ACIXNI_12335 [Bacteroides fragilis]
MPVDFVYIIGINGIGAAVETAYLSAEPDITRGDAGTLDLASGDDEVRAAVKNGIMLRASSCKFRISSE